MTRQRTRSTLLRFSLLTACSMSLALACTGEVEGTDGGAGDGSAGDTSVGDAELDGAPPDAGADAGDTGAGDTGTGDATVPPTGPDVDRTDPQLHTHELEPDALDPTVADNIETQFAYLDTRVAPLGKLVFFLPGATNTPSNWRAHGELLAGYGFHVVIPHYNNRWSSGGSNPCSGMGGDCSDNVRWEALTGEDASTVIDIPRQDSAEGRVIVMLQHLTTAHPGGDWGYYLDGDGELIGDRVIIAGISHGATSTGLFASRRTFWRAAMHSGGYWRIGDSPATPIGEIYGLSHTDDEQHPGHLSAWEAAGMLGAPTSIDGATPPYGDSRQLITSAPNGYPHCSVAVSGNSPMDSDGDFLFDDAWRTMYGVAELSR